ncbi:O-antigen ligase family protein [Simplicispira suum]|uniref:O-antigen ligase family protein n=1 Tax=Simplicispira suum TaxID=2109915 RepID=UPI0023559059|nr:O-antigen ligase family protein [Simplicispira suum]
MISILAPAQPLSWQERLSSVAAFAVPGLALWLPSGYSYGAVLLLLGTLLTLNRWPRQRHEAFTWWFAASMLAMAVVWAAQADPAEHFGRADRPAKFILGAACLLFVTCYPPRPRALLAGLAVGSLGAGGLALWQMYGLHAERAWGHTNAIQYGNLALCLATMLALYTGALWRQLRISVRVLCILGVLAGLDASVLSQSRGGWLALLLALPLGLAWLYMRRRETFRAVGLGVAAIVAVLMVFNGGVLMERVERMEHEIQTYDQRGEAGNSVGQRLEHWRFAWDIARERPLLGWGFAGYMAEKADRVAAGRYHPSIVEYKFVHNELLDQWVKLGILGPAMLLLFYALPLAMFLPKRERTKNYERDAELGAHALALRLCGTCIPVLYIGFGLTQVFFAHNSGIMFYLFMLMLLWAALRSVERQLDALAPPALASGALVQ